MERTSDSELSRDGCVLVRCGTHDKLGDPVLVDQVEDAVVDLIILRDEERGLDLRPVAEGEVGEEDLVHLLPLGLAMGEHQPLRGLTRGDLSY
jgi:hypothetical protein